MVVLLLLHHLREFEDTLTPCQYEFWLQTIILRGLNWSGDISGFLEADFCLLKITQVLVDHSLLNVFVGERHPCI